MNEIDTNSKIAFVSIDVDYYSSTKECLTLFTGDSNNFLPSTILT
jgi:hypothetical protein